LIVFGKQVFLYIVENHSNLIQEIILSKEIDRKLFNKIKKLNKKIIKIDNKKAQSLSKNGNHQGFFLKIDGIELYNYEFIKNKKFIVILDNITDMGNIGSIIRSSYAFGVDAIIITNIKQIKIQNIIRTSSGAAIELPIVHFFDIKDLVNRLKQDGFRLIGADINGINLKKFKKDDRSIALFVGNENQGISKKILSKLECYKIEMRNQFNSLNVANATSIFLYELL